MDVEITIRATHGDKHRRLVPGGASAQAVKSAQITCGILGDFGSTGNVSAKDVRNGIVLCGRLGERPPGETVQVSSS